MSKALLVMDMPTRCGTCVLRNSMAGDNAICHVTMQDLTDKEYFEEKPNWCPLKEDNEQEIRNKAIEEFAEKADDLLGSSDRDIYCKETIREIVESMKGEKE